MVILFAVNVSKIKGILIKCKFFFQRRFSLTKGLVFVVMKMKFIKTELRSIK